MQLSCAKREICILIVKRSMSAGTWQCKQIEMGRKQQHKVILASSELSLKIATPFTLNQAVI